MAEYTLSTGMEVHAELETDSKMFCRCPVEFGAEPNTRVCPVCLGMPGTLPVPNRKAIEFVLKTALALNCQIAKRSVFHRKNYFYPDLPKGYQISQFGDTNVLGHFGYLEVPTKNGGIKKINIRKVQIEEDTGKLMHLPSGGSGIDFNRAGVPLMEIVTDFPPDIETADEAKDYLVGLRQVLLYLKVCNGKMEEGSLRCEPNISIRVIGTDKYGTKTELKNLNSFRSVQHGIEYEYKRQVSLLENGESVKQETRGWDEGAEKTFPMRSKESEEDYKYFPDPDLVPMDFSDEYLEELKKTIPELPLAKYRRYQADYGLNHYDASILVAELSWSTYFDECIKMGGDPKLICNWMSSDFAKSLNETGQTFQSSLVTPKHLVELTTLIQKETISGKIGKDIFEISFKNGKMPSEIVQEKGLTQISDESVIEKYADEALKQNPELIDKYKSGQTNVIGFLVGQVMKQSKGRANPGIVQNIMKKKLDM